MESMTDLALTGAGDSVRGQEETVHAATLKPSLKIGAKLLTVV